MSDQNLVCPDCGANDLQEVGTVVASWGGEAHLIDGVRIWEEDGLGADVGWDGSSVLQLQCTACWWKAPRDEALALLKVEEVEVEVEVEEEPDPEMVIPSVDEYRRTLILILARVIHGEDAEIDLDWIKKRCMAVLPEEVDEAKLSKLLDEVLSNVPPTTQGRS